MKEKFTLDILLKQKDGFLRLFTKFYPIPDDLIELFKDVWDWEKLSENRCLNWSINLLKKHHDRWVWSNGLVLNHNPALPWSVDLIKLFIGEKKWDWWNLRSQCKIIEDPEMLALCLPEWTKICRESTFPVEGCYSGFAFCSWGENAELWAHTLVENTKDLLWDHFSQVEYFPWTLEFMEKHQDKLDWRHLSWNGGLPWTEEFIRRFEDRWHWDHMRALPWTEELLAAFENKWDWSWISMEGKVVWTPKMLERFSAHVWWAFPDVGYISWEGTFTGHINHPDIVWTPALFKKLHIDIEKHFKRLEEGCYKGEKIILKIESGEPVYWTYFCKTNNWSSEFLDSMIELEKEKGIKTINWSNVCEYGELRWNEEFIKKHYKILCRYPTLESEFFYPSFYASDIRRNPHFPWKDYLYMFSLKFVKEAWDDLSDNKGLKLNFELINRYLDKWNWRSLSANLSLTPELIETYKDKWNWEMLSTNPCITIEIIEKYEHKWDPWSWRQFSKLSFISIDTINRNKPWDWEYLFTGGSYYESNVKMTEYIDDELLERFLNALNE